MIKEMIQTFKAIGNNSIKIVTIEVIIKTATNIDKNLSI